MLTSSGKYSPGNSGGSAWDGNGISTINANHTHVLSSSDTETRPINMTCKIWKRIN